MPQKIKAALHQAAEIACGNVPELPGPIDRPGRVGFDGLAGDRPAWPRADEQDAVRGRGGPVRRRDPAAQPDNVVIPFDTAAYEARMDPTDLVLSLAERAGQVRRWRHQLLAAAGRRQRPLRQPAFRGLRAAE